MNQKEFRNKLDFYGLAFRSSKEYVVFKKSYVLRLSDRKLVRLANIHFDILSNVYKLRNLNFSELHFVSAVLDYRIGEISVAELRESVVAYLFG